MAVKRRFESAGKKFSDVPENYLQSNPGQIQFRNVSFPKLLYMGQYFLDMGIAATGAVFNGNVNFTCTNLGQSRFNNAHFHGDAFFEDAQIGFNASGGNVDFEDVIFHKQARFKKAKLCAAKFSRANFNETVDFEGAHFCTKPPVFNEIQLGGSINFPLNYNNWPDVTYLKDKKESVLPNIWRNAYHALAAMADSNMRPEETRFFVRQEFRCKRAVEERAGGRFLFWCYSFFSDYGQSISKPLFWLVVLWAIGAAAFAGYFSSCCPVAPLQDILDPIWTGIGTSFSNVFPLFGLRGSFMNNEIAAKLPMCLKYISAAQTVFSLPLIFLLGLGLRNRFRLR